MATEMDRVVTENKITGDASQLENELKKVLKISDKINQSFKDYNKNMTSAYSVMKQIEKSMEKTSTRAMKKFKSTAGAGGFYGAGAIINETASREFLRNDRWGDSSQAALITQGKLLKQREQDAELIKKATDANYEYNKSLESSVKNFQRINATGGAALAMVQARLMANYMVINKVTDGFKYLLNYTVQFDDELRNLQAISAVSNTGLAGLRDTIMDVANATKFTSLEVSQTATVLAQAGLSVSQIQGALPAIANLATATGTDLATATDTITSALNIYNLQVSEAVQVTNALTTAVNESKADIQGFQYALQYAGNFAAQLGMSYEETAAAVAAATQAGIRSKSMLGTGLRAVLTELLSPTKKLVDQLAKVGLTVDDIDVSSKGFITVLKNMREAGFGAAEAFQGMERRGAAYLSALINQTDFMDSLLVKMSGSTAAAKANETQMQSLSNTWNNFLSIAGSVTYKGLAPFITALQKVISTLNTLGGSKIGGVIGAMLVGGTATAGLAVTFSMFLKFIKGMKELVVIVQRLSSAGKTGSLLTTLGGISTKAWLGWATAIGVVISALAQLSEHMGIFKSTADKIQAELEETKGKLGEEEEAYTALSKVLQKAYIEQDKFSGEASQQQLNKFTREIVTRFPEANQILQGTAESFEQIIETINKLQNISLAKTVAEMKRLSEVSQDAAKQSFKDTFRDVFDGFSYNKSVREYSGIVNRLKEYMPGLDTRGLSIASITGGEIKTRSAIGREAGVRLEQAIESYARKISDNPSDYLRTLSNFEELKELKEALNQLADKVDAENALRETELRYAVRNSDLSLLTQKEIANINTNLDGFNSSLNFISKSMLNPTGKTDQELLEERQKYIEVLNSTKDYISNVQKRQDTISKSKTISELSEATGVDQAILRKSFEDWRKSKPYSQNISEEDFVAAAIKQQTEDYREVNNRLVDVLSKIEDKLSGDNGYSASLRQAEKNINTRIGLLSGMSGSQRETERMSIEQSILSVAEWKRKAGGVELIDPSKNEGTLEQRSLAREIDEWQKSQLEKLKNSTANIEKALSIVEVRTTAYFNDLEARLKQIDTQYRNMQNELNKPLTIQEGRVEGATRRFGASSTIAEYENIRLENMQKAQLQKELELNQNTYDQYMRELISLQTRPEYLQLQQRIRAATEKRDSALASGNATAAAGATRELENLTNSSKKYETKINDLTSKTTDLSNEILKADEALGYRSNTTPWQDATYGVQAGVGVYQNTVEQNGLLEIEGVMSSLTSSTLTAADQGFQTLFRDIVDGSASAGEAFRNFGITVLETMRDIAIKAVTNQLFSAALGAFSFGGSEVISESGGSISTGFSTVKSAQGGLITGPIKNRDSVLTKLMPGEFVMKKSAVDTLGVDFFNGLNNNSGEVIASQSENTASSLEGTDSSANPGGVVNVWVVSQDQVPAPGPNDIIATITQDIRRGGITKKLIKQVSMGG